MSHFLLEKTCLNDAKSVTMGFGTDKPSYKPYAKKEDEDEKEKKEESPQPPTKKRKSKLYWYTIVLCLC